jgi:hypothetical protein
MLKDQEAVDQESRLKKLMDFDVYVTVHHAKFPIIKPTRCTNFSNLFLE